MSGEYQVAPEAIRRFGRTSEERSARLREIRSQLGSHQLSGGAFGKLPESDEIAQDYLERSEAAITNIGSAAESMERLNEYAEGLARSYQSIEEGLSDELRTMTQGLS